MKEFGVFDILGPTMIGPSSSHTAGAARLGNIAKVILGQDFKKVNFYLHGSFAKTSKGHGTDKALLAGVIGLKPDDERLPHSFKIANDLGISYEFYEKELEYPHPNTVKIEFHLKNNTLFYIIGSSIGGGNIKIYNINGTEVDFSGNQPTILIRNKDTKGVIAHISTVLSEEGVNIATMSVVRKNDMATMVIEIDSYIKKDLIDKIASLKDIKYITGINPIKE